MLLPKIPECSLFNENIEKERISLAPSIFQCLQSVGITDKMKENAIYIYVYEVNINQDDDNLISWKTLFYEGKVDDAVLTHEYWYTNPVVPMTCSVYCVLNPRKKKYYIVSADKKEQLQDEINSLGINDPEVENCNSFEILNKWMSNQDNEIQEKILSKLTKTLEEFTEEQAEVYYKIFHEKRKRMREEKEYMCLPYLEACTIENFDEMKYNIGEKYIFYECSCEEIHQYNKAFHLTLAWNVLDENYVWNNNTFLYKITDTEDKVVAFLYYGTENIRKLYTIYQFEVIESIRSKGIGEKIIRQFYEQEGISGADVQLEPLTMGASRFWTKCGVEC